VLLTHDVDSPLFHLGAPISREVTSVAGDLIKRKDVSLAAKRIGSAFAARRGNHDGDPNNTFDYLMSVSERHSLRSAFYFITGGDAPNDGGYSMQMPWIESLVRRIGAKGHEIGLHPSYHTYLDPGETAAQARTLRECAQRNGIQQESWGGRQHYLRWRAGTTWRNWEDAGMDYDSSMGFAEMIGFRSGCCHEHGTFNVLERAPMRLRERPLLLMETTLISYMQLDGSRRLEVASGLIAACRLYDGDMTLLWHNSKVVSKAERMEYEAVVDMAVSA
jgi:peptidoglycan/xylan/chitin deacetylase (PgdA/CDA1 family)